MKKKIKDCSVLELRKFCNERNCTDGGDCPFVVDRKMGLIYCAIQSPCCTNDSVLDEEIEIPEEAKIKRKIKDLTVAQLYEYCREKDWCDDCSLNLFCFYARHSVYSLEEETLDEEIEIPEEVENAKTIS